MEQKEKNLAPEVEKALDNLSIDQIQDFLSELLIPRHCHLCHGLLHVIGRYEFSDTVPGLTQSAEWPALVKLTIQESRHKEDSYEMELPCFTLGCLRCGNLNRLTVAPVLEYLRTRKVGDEEA